MHGKVIILFEAKSVLIFALAYLGYMVNILVLAVVTAHLSSLTGVVDMLTAYAGFVGLINLDNAIGGVVTAYWYPEVKGLFKKPVYKRDLDYSFRYLKFVFCCFNIWGIIFNSYLYSQRHLGTLEPPAKIDIRKVDTLQWYTNANWSLLHIGVLLMLVYSKFINPIAVDDEFEKLDVELKPAVTASQTDEITTLKAQVKEL